MPGHAKAGKGGADEDPAPYLIVSLDQRREDQMKPYDPKKSYWVPDNHGGYVEAVLEEDDGKNAKVLIKGYEVSFRRRFTSHMEQLWEMINSIRPSFVVCQMQISFILALYLAYL